MLLSVNVIRTISEHPVMKLLSGLVLIFLCCSELAAQSIDPAAVPAMVPKSGTTASLLQSPAKSTALPVTEQPYGSNLFKGGFSGDQEDGLNPDYVVSPGDQINLRIWGAVEMSNVVVVDPQGNIFIPSVGPVMVGGVKNRDLNARVTSAVSQVYTDNVSVYTSLNGTQPVAVFVTGYVPKPGRYAGVPSTSVLYFLDRAGGIDPQTGSYRDIRVLRDNEVIASADLYGFMVEGKLPKIQFRDGDTVVVGQRGSTVTVSGDINNAAVYEFLSDSILGSELEKSVLLKPGVTYVGLSGTRNDKPFSVYLEYQQFRETRLYRGDSLYFRADTHDDMIVVDVEGVFEGPSRFALPRNTRLPELLDYIPVDLEMTNTADISIKRKSIAVRQRASLESSLRRLESQYLTASSQTDAEAVIRAQEAKMIAEFVSRARAVEPSGRLVVSSKGAVADVMLQNGDVIHIPTRSDSVLLSGEVLVAQAILFDSGLSAREYIDRSGGFSQQADQKRIVLVHANGEITSGKNPVVRPGDEIIVLPKVPVKNLQIASVIVDILYKIAVAASVAVAL